MPSPKREYSRLYHDLVDDPMFSEVYADDALFGAWSKLLMLGDASWPASAPIPASVTKARLVKLVTAGLISTSGGRFRIRGMDKERGARSDHGKRGADGRWHGPEQSPPDAGSDDDGMPTGPTGIPRAPIEHPSGNAEGMPSKDEQSKAETSNTPLPPPSGGVRVNPRTNGTNPRAIGAAVERERRKHEVEEQRRLDAIRLAYLEGRLNADQEREMRRNGGWPGAAA